MKGTKKPGISDKKQDDQDPNNQKIIEASQLRKQGFYYQALKLYQQIEHSYQDKLDHLPLTKKNAKKKYDISIHLLRVKSDIALTYYYQGLNTQSYQCYQEVLVKLLKLHQSKPSSSQLNDLIFRIYFQIIILECDQKNVRSAEKNIQLAQSYLPKEKVPEEHQGQIYNIQAKLATLDKNWQLAKTNYKQAINFFKLAKDKFSSEGNNRAYADAYFNMARCLEQLDELKDAEKCLRESLRVIKKHINKSSEHPDNARRQLELARILEKRYLHEKLTLKETERQKLLEESISLLQEIAKAHHLHMGKNSFHRYDLLEHHHIIKCLVRWYIELGRPAEAGRLCEAEPKKMDNKFSFERLMYFKLAEQCYQQIDSKQNAKDAARVLELQAEVLISLSVPDYAHALIAIEKANYYEATSERSESIISYQKKYQDFFNGWSSDLIAEWNWAVENYHEFELHWFQDFAVADDLFHWKQRQVILPPNKRMQLMMVVTRLYGMLDQAYYDFVNKVIYQGDKAMPSDQYFPMAISEVRLKHEWKQKQKVWERKPKTKSQKITGFGQPEFKSIHDAIIAVQPYVTLDSKREDRHCWLFPLRAIANYSKHIHLGVQELPPQYIQQRVGLLQHRFQGLEIGITRMRNEVYPFSFTRLLESEQESRNVYDCLTQDTVGILVSEVRRQNTAETKILDNQVAIVAPIQHVKDYLATLEQEGGAPLAKNALLCYRQLVKQALSTKTSLNDIDMIKVADYLMNLAAQAHGFEQTKDRIKSDELFKAAFSGIAFLLEEFANTTTKLSKRPVPELKIPVLATTQFKVRSLSSNDSFIQELEEKYKTNSQLLVEKDSKAITIKVLREFHQDCQQLLQNLLISKGLSASIEFCQRVQEILPYWLANHYAKQIHELKHHLIKPNFAPFGIHHGTSSNLFSENLIACDLISIPSFSDKDKLSALPIKSNAGYVRSGQRLWYVNKLDEEGLEIKLKKTKLETFDSKMQPGHESKMLSNQQLADITLLTSHTHLGHVLIDDDVLARLSYLQKDLYDELPYNFFLEQPARCLNIIANIYLNIHFILDQVFTRYYDRVFAIRIGASLSNIKAYPDNEKNLAYECKQLSANELIKRSINNILTIPFVQAIIDIIIGYLAVDELFLRPNFSPSAQQVIRDSLKWWKSFRAESLKIKHAGFLSFTSSVIEGVGNKKSVFDLDIKHSQSSQQSTGKAIQLMHNLKAAFEYTTYIVWFFFREIAKQGLIAPVYAHLQFMPQFTAENYPHDFSLIDAMRSAQESNKLTYLGSQSSSQELISFASSSIPRLLPGATDSQNNSTLGSSTSSVNSTLSTQTFKK